MSEKNKRRFFLDHEFSNIFSVRLLKFFFFPEHHSPCRGQAVLRKLGLLAESKSVLCIYNKNYHKFMCVLPLGSVLREP